MGSITGHSVNTSTVNDFTNFDAILDTAAELYGINRETVRGVIQLKSEVSANTELLACVQVQLKSTMSTLHAMSLFQRNLHEARAMVLLISRDEAGCSKSLERIESMRSFLEKFKLVCDKHEQLTVIGDLSRRKHDLEDKLGRIKARTNAWNIAQWIAKFGVTVLSVLIPVAGVRPAATAANNGVNGVIGLLQPLIDSHLTGQQSSCEVEIDLTAKILNEAWFICHRVKNARVLVELLQLKMGSLAEYAKILNDLAVSMVMDEIKSKAGELVDIIQNLEKEVDLSCEDLRRSALTLLQTITVQVGNSQHLYIEIRTQ
ncbi:hypothetical protein IHE45_07G032500 [Dioscorea alata]|uniref:Uncharacterized protein n=1 Tax=Dioscorea alata TaxID=55571 RepID=A0ACB7VQG3_DIOAL|nr:hypothetical protein IHE45_07G032500 [Dioscorea alata]